MAHICMKECSTDANEEHNEVSPHSCENDYHNQINKQQVLARLWRKGKPSALLVGVRTGAATVENSMECPQKN